MHNYHMTVRSIIGNKNNYFLSFLLSSMLFVLSFLLICNLEVVRAQNNPAAGAALSVKVNQGEGETIDTGDILVLSNEGDYFLAKKAYDGRLVGVVSDEPAISFNDTFLEEGKHFMVSQGEAFVNVSTINGAIKKGDFITSSEKAGIGQKADNSGQILGIALQPYDAGSSDDIGDILVQVDPRPNVLSDVKVNLIDAWRKGTEAPFLTPLTSLRYVLAALVTAGAFVVGFSSFGKASGKGVEALGRNPLAEKTIKKGMVFNMVLTFFIMSVGLVLAYLILVL